MIEIAHIGGIPVGELLPALYAGGGLWIAVRALLSGFRPRCARARQAGR
jgi:hypothetical protein